MVAGHQRTRLEAAMVEAVARHGYAGTTLRELVRLAGVSKSTFYEHFESKQDAFLETSADIVAQMSDRARAAYASGTGPRERFLAALSCFMELVAGEPQAANLTTVETLTLGRAGIEHRDRGSEIFEETARRSFEESGSEIEVPGRTLHAIAAGIRGVVYRHLRAGTAAQLPGLAAELADWALGYQVPRDEAVESAAATAAKPSPDPPPGPEIEWSEPPDSQRSRAELSQRERIVRAVGQLVVEDGYETLTIPAISARAGTSNQTFYEHFDNKREAFLASFDGSAAEALSATSRAFESAEGPAAIGAALRGMLEYIAGNELFARLAFFDLQTAGPVALDRADSAMASFAAFLGPGVAPRELRAVASPNTLEAIASGTWAVIQHELDHGKYESLPELAPELVEIVLTPLTAR
ncbi:MAG TPA: TetR/AcrR family transcriptional regulator [Solirubrobacterales bacterium]|nr:TetR/AcrR family transcriptional regulator [Solirubrobacterales bacterium]